jgi:hypothetical protein
METTEGLNFAAGIKPDSKVDHEQTIQLIKDKLQVGA